MAETVAFGPWLKQQRRRLDLTQEALARRAACSLSTLRKIETGDLVPSKELAQLLAAALEIPAPEQAAFVAFARGVSVNAPPLDRPQPALTLATISTNVQQLAFLTAVAMLPGASPTRKYRLPAQLTALIGREWELLLGKQLISRSDVRLITLSGPPGTGKSRLSLAIAEAVQDLFADGVCFVPLTPINDPALLPDALAQALGLSGDRVVPLLAALQEFLQAKELLLVLDNFEQILAGAETLVMLLQAAPALKIMVTSRIVLRVYGEYEFPVPTLALPPEQPLPAADDLMLYSAVNLFVQRARAIRPSFTLTHENAETIVQICRALDGLPLAIEMAATQVKWQVLPRLLMQLQRQRLLLSGAARNLPPHQKTLRATLDWSYHLLSEQEQQIFNHLAVFVGGCTLEAITAVVGMDVPIEPVLQTLVDHSLLGYEVTSHGLLRYTLLETIREYVSEQLQASAAQSQAQATHAAYFLQLAQAFQASVTEGNRKEWLDRLDVEHPNFRAALAWYAEQDHETGLRLLIALSLFWNLRGYIAERHHWLTLFLSSATQWQNPPLLAQALQLACYNARYMGDHEEATRLSHASLALYQELADQQGVAKALVQLGTLAFYQNEYQAAESYYQQALSLYRALADQRNEAHICSHLGTLAKDQGDFVKARDYYNAGLGLHQALHNRTGMALSFNDLSDLAYWQADFVQAERLAQECLALQRQSESKIGIAYALAALGSAQLQQGERSAVLPLFEESLVLFRAIGERSGIVIGLENWGRLAMAQGQSAEAQRSFQEGIALAWQIREKQRLVFCLEGYAAVAHDPTQAVQLYGAAAALRTAIGTPIPLFDHNAIQERITLLRERLGDSDFAQAWHTGQTLALTDVVALALLHPPQNA